MALEIIDVSDANINKVISMLEGLSLLTTSFLLAERKENPANGKGFVTIPAVEDHFGTARKNSGALVIAYLPEILPSEVGAWSKYSTDKQGWIQESHQSYVNVTDSILPSIWGYPPEERFRTLGKAQSTCGILGHRRKLLSDEERAQRTPLDPDAGPFSPVWMFSPPPHADDVGIINFDLRAKTVMRQAIDYIATTKLPTFLDVCNQAAWFDNQEHLEILQTVIAFPVYDGFDIDTSDIVGHLVAIVPWAVFFQNIALKDSPPVTVVLENTCDETLAFEIEGYTAKFLAESDVHDTGFDDMVLTGAYARIEDYQSHAIEDPALRRSEEVEDMTCKYTISIYPTKSFEDAYLTTQPVWYACLVVGIFFLTSLLFIVFDRFVRKRTEKVMNVALRQNAIVSSLFPKSVQAKMMAEVDEHERLGRLGKAGIKSFLNADKGSTEGSRQSLVSNSKPIAGRCYLIDNGSAVDCA